MLISKRWLIWPIITVLTDGVSQSVESLLLVKEIGASAEVVEQLGLVVVALRSLSAVS